MKTAIKVVVGCFVALLIMGGCGAAVMSLGAGNIDPIDSDISTTVGEVPVQAKATADTPAGTRSQLNALKSAEQYLDFTAFSKNGLIRQLSSPAGDKYSKSDATWAVNHLKVNWKEQAVKSAEEYLTIQSFSRNGLIRQLSSKAGSGFTVSEATYAADKVGL